jgi:hypothetical protein
LRSLTSIGTGYFVFLPFAVCPNLAYPQQYNVPLVSIAIECDAPHAIKLMGFFFNIFTPSLEEVSYLKK